MKHWYTNGVDELCIDSDINDIPEGYFLGRSSNYKECLKGRSLSEETKAKISQKTKGRTAHNKGKKETVKHIYYTNGTINIRIKETDNPPEGFYRGRIVKWSEENKKSQGEKVHKTNLKLHGAENYNNIEKNKNTKTERYGNPNYNNREKESLTSLEKYGVPNPSMSEEVKLKIKNTNINKYGYSGSFSNPKVLEKAIVHSQTEESRQQRMDTCLSRYGVPYAGCIFGVPNSRDSQPNLNFKKLLIDNNLYESDEINREFSLGKYRYDFKINNILIEINPSITHNSTKALFEGYEKDKNYHKEKTQVALENGYRCVHIWDWDDINKVLNLLQPFKRKLFARKCEIRNVNNLDAKTFIQANHLQGFARSEINLGLYYENELVSIMTFGKPRYNKNYEYELIRYCSSCKIIGGAEKLFNHFIKEYTPKSIISYCDMSKFTGDTYIKLGFKYQSTSIGKHWYNIKTEQHITDNLLRSQGFDRLFKTNYGKGSSNEQLMLENGFVEIYDAGQSTYVYNNIN